MIAKTSVKFLQKVSTKRFTQNYCFQESGWLPLVVAHQITGYTDFPWKQFAKTLMRRHIMQKIPWYCKFNVLFIWLKIAAVSAWNFKFQISCFLCLKTFKVNVKAKQKLRLNGNFALMYHIYANNFALILL